MLLSPEEKRRFLKALEEDPEFRYAAAGLLGLGEVLNELWRLRADFNKFVELEGKRWEENWTRWEENNRRWEEDNKRWEENWRRWEENSRRWEENEKKWEENRKQWEAWFEAWKKFLGDYERRWEGASKRFDNIERRLSNVETTLGASVEAQFSRYVWEDLREVLEARGESVIRRTRNAMVDNVDVDLLLKAEKRVYVVEVKIRPGVEDVGTLLAKADVVTSALGKETVPILTGAWIGDDVEKYARGKGVLVYKH
ncbi:MAG: hypothetical protein OWQ51_09945 [Pyrobaculum arsenaticum]|uniref:hypothetical protein n=1 Tax=Pyrobaculum arsenaticum TaxID=121277 RepID=UPI0022737D7C|nr:hypothetical protein [Pyrobaculum arsenaticum]